jgi:hypothetical protein
MSFLSRMCSLMIWQWARLGTGPFARICSSTRTCSLTRMCYLMMLNAAILADSVDDLSFEAAAGSVRLATPLTMQDFRFLLPPTPSRPWACHMRRRIHACSCARGHVPAHSPSAPLPLSLFPSILERGPMFRASYEEEDTCMLMRGVQKSSGLTQWFVCASVCGAGC